MTSHSPLPAPIGRKDLAIQLRWLAEHMRDIATSMHFCKGMKAWERRSTQMVGVASIMYQWADDIENQES